MKKNVYIHLRRRYEGQKQCFLKTKDYSERQDIKEQKLLQTAHVTIAHDECK